MATSAAIWTLPRVPDDIKRLRVGADCSIFPVSPIIVSNQRAGGSYKKHMDTLWRDVCFGLRLLAKNKGFAAVAVLALALGIGPNTAIFSVIYATLLAPMPYPQPDQLVVVWSKIQGSRNVVSAGDFLDWIPTSFCKGPFARCCCPGPRTWWLVWPTWAGTMSLPMTRPRPSVCCSPNKAGRRSP